MVGYLSYLLRLRWVDSEGGPVWRTSLQCPGTLESIDFADLEGLLAFLRAEMERDIVAEPLERHRAQPPPESRL